MDIDLLEIAYAPTTGVRRMHETPLIAATEASLKGYGCLVDDPKTFPIEIVRWPAQGWRPIDENSGNQGGHSRRAVRILLEGRDAVRPKQRGGRQLSLRLEQL